MTYFFIFMKKKPMKDIDKIKLPENELISDYKSEKYK